MKEIQEERRRLTAALRAEGINASFEIQPQQNRILLYPSDPAKLQTLISSGGLTLRDFVIVQNKPLTRKPEAAIEGGGDTSGTYVDPVDKQTYGNNCSAAFSVVSGSVRGISTAGHCAQYSGQTQYHRGANIGTFQSRQQATGVDAAWFRNTANTYTNRVRWNSTTYYSITGIASASPAIGSSICLIKRDTTQLCAYVKSTGIYFGDDGPYVAADRDVSVSGDSGGPWLYGGLAYGIHSGDVDTSVGTLSFFTPGPSLSQMGLSIATN